jgi:hypothetical protein
METNTNTNILHITSIVVDCDIDDEYIGYTIYFGGHYDFVSLKMKNTKYLFELNYIYIGCSLDSYDNVEDIIGSKIISVKFLRYNNDDEEQYNYERSIEMRIITDNGTFGFFIFNSQHPTYTQDFSIDMSNYFHKNKLINEHLDGTI